MFHYLIILSWWALIFASGLNRRALSRETYHVKKMIFMQLKGFNISETISIKKKRKHHTKELLEVCILNFSLLTTRPLSSAEASLCCGEAGGKEKESMRGIRSHRPPHAFYFFHYCYFYRDTQWEPLRRRELPDFYRWWGQLFTQQHCVMTISFFGKIENVFS